MRILEHVSAQNKLFPISIYRTKYNNCHGGRTSQNQFSYYHFLFIARRCTRHRQCVLYLGIGTSMFEIVQPANVSGIYFFSPSFELKRFLIFFTMFVGVAFPGPGAVGLDRF